MVEMIRQRLAVWLRRIAMALDVPVLDPLKARALALVEKADREMEIGTGGEYKRHVVYAKLLKEFPNRRASECSLAIELAVASRG